VKTIAGFGPVRSEREQQIAFTAGSTTHEVTIPEDSLANNAAGAAGFLFASGKELVRRVRKRLRR